MIIGGSTTFDIGSTAPLFGTSAVTAPAVQSAYPGSVMGGGLSVTNPLSFDPIVGASPFASSVTTYETPFVSPAPFVYPTAAQPNSVLYAHYAPYTAPAATTTTPAAATPAVTAAPAATTTPAATTAATTAGGGAAKPDEQKRKAQQRKEKAAEADKAEPKKPAAKKTVTVKAGDTLSKIAAAHGVSWQKLYELNKGVIGGNPNLIRPGQNLKLP